MKNILRILSLFLSMLFFVSGCSVDNNDNINESTENTTTATIITTQTNTVELFDDKLESIIKDNIPVDNGDWAVYYKNLSDNKFVSINNKKMVSASLIKLFIMGMVYSKISLGEIESTNEIEELIKNMITISHNDSSNRLVEIAGNDDFETGMKYVNEYAASIKCFDTEQQRNMLDSRPVPVKEQNYTSVEDCGKLLELIYKKKCVSPDFDEQMLDLMLHQERRWKIPAGLPDGVKVANKTGELSTTENDVAIIFTSEADYILCIISNDLSSTGSAQETICKISSRVYDYVIQNY